MNFWTVSLSYRVPGTDRIDKPYRQNATVGVVADSCESAIALARSAAVPPGCDGCKVWSVNHHGKIGAIQEQEEK